MARTPQQRRPLFVARFGIASVLALFALVAAGPASPSRPRVVLETVRGDIVIELHPEDAPQTVANFTKLVKQGFYDSLTFHRVVPGFVIQGGDPNSRDANPFNDGQGGPGYTVPAEIKAKHVKGAVAMARMPDGVNPTRASSGSQFYIALKDLAQLDGGYTVFGQVVSGWATIDSIVALSDRTDIARVGTNANPGTLAMIRHARVLSPAKSTVKPPASTTPADSAR
jgi:cyclophilin family peptidyl-prolyl cis-trans isomerase